ncbi:DinB family protein [Cellulomonas sp. B6]|uniref:DinB family protein n=1 Tax=Cellulomonas sp. B6 TaxID=1295626 RepID=UPI000A85B6ED|nr:DinB family protein [Cellulomonas sp. B6]
MPTSPVSSASSPASSSERTLLETFLDGCRTALPATLDGLDEEQVRRRLVSSRTTLLGLLKHLTYVEAFWFQHAVTGASLRDLGVASTPDRSFVLRKDDSAASLRAAHAAVVEASRAAVAGRPLDEVVTGRGRPVSVRFVHLQVLKEYAQHTGHADILREQLLAG